MKTAAVLFLCIVASVEVSVPVIKEFTLYDFKIEARLSFHF